MKMKDIAIYGSGGLGREIASLIKKINEIEPTWNLIGFFDDGLEKNFTTNYGVVLGGLDELNSYKHPLNVVIAIATPSIIEQLVANITNKNVKFPNLIAPTVLFFNKSTVKIGKGNIINHTCRISCDIEIGDFNILNGSVSLGHDVKLGNYNVLQPDVRISGETIIGDKNFFGVRSTGLQQITIGSNTRIGAGSIVMRNTKDNKTYFGVPARIMKE